MWDFASCCLKINKMKLKSLNFDVIVLENIAGSLSLCRNICLRVLKLTLVEGTELSENEIKFEEPLSDRQLLKEILEI